MFEHSKKIHQRSQVTVRKGGIRRIGWLIALALLATGCVVVPYQPEGETRETIEDVPRPELIRLSTGPRQFLEGMAGKIAKTDPRIQFADGQVLLDAAAPDGELTLAELLDPATGPRIASLEADYLVLLGEPVDEEVDAWGGVLVSLGFFGLGQSTTTSMYWAALVELETMRLVKQLTATATGTDRGIGLFYGLFIESDTRGGAEQALVRRVIEDIAAERPSGPVRAILLAVEPIRTAEDLAADESRIRQTQAFDASSIVAYPPFSEPAAPGPEEGLIYVYRPFDIMGSALPLTMRNRTQAGEFEITRLWSGGYVPFRVPAGTVLLWAEGDPSRTVTLDVESGGVYYVRATYRIALSSQIPSRLEVVEATRGRPQVIQCRLVPATAEYVAQTHAAAEQGFTAKQLELADLYARGVAFGPGVGLPQDDVAAYQWYSIVLAASYTRKEWRSAAGTARHAVATRMDSEQIARAAALAVEWQAAFDLQQLEIVEAPVSSGR
jgi:hypothetical protein